MGLPDETLRIETPENVAFGYEVAGIGSRFLAALVDTTIISVIQAIILLAGLTLLGGTITDLPEQDSSLAAWMIAAIALFLFLIYWGYYIFFEITWNGQSPGKRMVGLRVIRVDGTPITLAESVIRNLVRLIDFLPTFYGIGVITMFIHPQSRRLGDLAAGTLVVHDRGTVTLESLEPTTPAIRQLVASPALEYPTEPVPINLLQPADLHMAEEFLRRRQTLHGERDLAQRIARSLYERMGLPETYLSPEASVRFIEQVLQAARAQERPIGGEEFRHPSNPNDQEERS